MPKNRIEQGASPRVESILVPIDFSAFSSRSLEYASAFAEQFGARLILVTVIEAPMPSYDLDYVSSSMVEWYEQAQRETAEKLATFAAQHLNGDLNYSCFARNGEPTREILAVAAEHHADLIVMGTHGRTGVKHMFMGSVAEKTIRHATCPAMVIRLAQREFVCETAVGPRLELLEIIAPVDFSEGSMQALQWAETLAEKSGARLNLLHVVPFHYAIGEYDALEYPQLEAELMETGRQRLTTLVKGILERGIEVQSAVVRGTPRHEILQFAEQQKGDIIIMGTRGLTGLKHLLLGSTAEYVVRHASSAVLTIPYPKGGRKGEAVVEPHVATA